MKTLSFPYFMIALGLLLASACGAKRQAQWESTPQVRPAATPGETRETLEQKGDTAWEHREEQSAVEAAIKLWEEALALAPETLALHHKLARAWYFLADGHMRKQGTGSEAYLGTFEKCISAGERGLAASKAAFKAAVLAGEDVEKAIALIDVTGVPSAYWYASCLGKWARAKGFATTLANKDRIKAVMTKVLALDPEFFHGAPDRYFGAFYAVAPSFAGGDMDKSRQHFDKSLQRAPLYAGTKVLMAETYAAKLKDRALFDRLLDEVLAQTDDAHAELIPETRVEKQKAQELKARAEELF